MVVWHKGFFPLSQPFYQPVFELFAPPEPEDGLEEQLLALAPEDVSLQQLEHVVVLLKPLFPLFPVFLAQLVHSWLFFPAQLVHFGLFFPAQLKCVAGLFHPHVAHEH
jgi:hypothetical protein